MNTTNYIQNHVKKGKVLLPVVAGLLEHRMPVSRVTCKDGFSISVQASQGHYCSPRVNNPGASGYDTFELGYPSQKEQLICSYAENPSDPTDTVYAQVPTDVLVELLDAHGGIDTDKTETDLAALLNQP